MGLNLESTISLNSAAFERGIDRAKESVVDLAKNFVIGAIGIGTVEHAFEKTVETATELVNSAKRLNMTVEQVQLLRAAAKSTGQEFEMVATAIEKINIARAKALGGDRSALAAFTALGVDRQKLLSSSAADLMMKEIGNKVKSVNAEQIAAPLREVLGRGAGQGIAFLKTDFEELKKSMEETGAIMSGEVAAKLRAIGEEFEMISRIIVSQLAPALLAFAEWAYKVVLKAGGNIAGAGAFWGTVAAKMAQAPEDPNNPNRTKTGRVNFWKELWDQVFNKNSEAKKSFDQAQAPFDLKIEEFQKMLKNAADSVNNPKPDFNATARVAKQMAGHHEGKAQSDALIRVGNFLGSSRNTINSAQGLLAQHTAQTASNTKRAADALDAIKIKLPAAYSQQFSPSLGSGTIWPPN